MILEKNFLEVYTYERWNANILPNFQTGQTFGPSSLEIKQGETSRPKLLSEAELINLMDKSGIGTDATIHEHIKKIQDREYAVKNQQSLFLPTILGCSLISAYRDMEIEISLAKPDLRSLVCFQYILIVQMELKMKDVCEQRITKEVMIRQVLNMYRNAFQVANGQSHLFKQVCALKVDCVAFSTVVGWE
jgi:DNA topoisomerase-3